MAKSIKLTSSFLANVPEANRFWCHDGSVLSNLADLSKALATMGDDTFKYHSNREKSDFGNWVKDIIGDKQLALSLNRIKNRTVAAQKVSERLKSLSKR